MSDEPENFTLISLRRLDEKQDRVITELQDLKQRVTGLELGQARTRQEIADLHANDAGLQLRLDRIDQRLDRIERRLDLQDAR